MSSSRVFAVVFEGRTVFNIEVPEKSKSHAIYAAVAERLGLKASDPKGKSVQIEVEGKRVVRMFGVNFGKLRNATSVTLVSPSPTNALSPSAHVPRLPSKSEEQELERKAAKMRESERTRGKEERKAAKAKTTQEQEQTLAREEGQAADYRPEAASARHLAAGKKNRNKPTRNQQQKSHRTSYSRAEKKKNEHMREEAEAEQLLRQQQNHRASKQQNHRASKQQNHRASPQAQAAAIAETAGFGGNVIATTEVKRMGAVGKNLYTKALGNGDKVSAVELTEEQAKAMGIHMPAAAAAAAPAADLSPVSSSPAASSSDGATITLTFKRQPRLFPFGPPGDVVLDFSTTTVQDIFNLVKDRSLPLGVPAKKYRLMLVQGRKHVLQAKRGKIRNSKLTPAALLSAFGVECDGVHDGVHTPKLAAMFNYPI